jgi:hypothetical protein
VTPPSVPLQQNSLEREEYHSTNQLLEFPLQKVIIIAYIQPGDKCSPFQRTGTGEIR